MEQQQHIWFGKLEEQLPTVPIYSNPRRRKRMWEEHVIGNTINEGIILEFGVASGGSIGWFPKHFKNTKIYGFDSFFGLPEDWYLGSHTLKKGHFSTNGIPPTVDNVEYVVGLFEDTLLEWKEKEKEVAKIIHIDCDIYSACKYVLTNIKDRIAVGTFILFDELTHLQGDKEYFHNRLHEYKAFKEFCEENPTFDFQVIARTDGPQVAIKVLAI